MVINPIGKRNKKRGKGSVQYEEVTVLNKVDRENSLKRCHLSKEWEVKEQTTRISVERIPGRENSGCKSSEAGT